MNEPVSATEKHCTHLSCYRASDCCVIHDCTVIFAFLPLPGETEFLACVRPDEGPAAPKAGYPSSPMLRSHREPSPWAELPVDSIWPTHRFSWRNDKYGDGSWIARTASTSRRPPQLHRDGGVESRLPSPKPRSRIGPKKTADRRQGRRLESETRVAKSRRSGRALRRSSGGRCGRSARSPIILTEAERTELEALARSTKTEYPPRPVLPGSIKSRSGSRSCKATRSRTRHSPRSNNSGSTSMPSSRPITKMPRPSPGPNPQSIKSASKHVSRTNDSGY